MTTTAPVSDTFTITEEILVRATLDKTFASLTRVSPLCGGPEALFSRARHRSGGFS